MNAPTKMLLLGLGCFKCVVINLPSNSFDPCPPFTLSLTFFYAVAIAVLQIDYIRRRQHISTIDTNSPTRGLLSQATTSGQTYVPTVAGVTGAANVPGTAPGGGIGSGGMPQMHGAVVGGHNPMGYCTLRNGSKQATANHSMVSTATR